jgi:hypothetical protein
MSCKPSSGVQNEVSSERFNAGEDIFELTVIDMAVVSLPGFIVVTKDANVIDDEGEPILEVVPAAANWLEHSPDDELGSGLLAKTQLSVFNFDRIHLSPPPR